MRRCALWRDRPLPLLVLFDQPSLLELLDEALLVLVLEIVEVAHDLIAVVHQIFADLVEKGVGRLGLELLAAVPLAVFERGHNGSS